MMRRFGAAVVGICTLKEAYAFTPYTVLPRARSSMTVCSTRGRNAVIMSDDLQKLQAQAQKLREEAMRLEKELVASGRVVVAAAPPPPRKIWTFEEIKNEVAKMSTSSDSLHKGLLSLKEEGALSKFSSFRSPGFRKYSVESFISQTSIRPEELEPGSDYKTAFGVVLGVSALAVVGGNALGGNIGSLIVYLSLLTPILVAGVGTVSPGVIAALTALVANTLDGRGAERKAVHDAARMMAGYMMGMKLASYNPEGKRGTEVKFLDTAKGSVAAASPKSKTTQDDILQAAILSITGSVAERLVFGKVLQLQGDFDELLRLISAVNPPLNPKQRNELVLYAAVQAHKLVSENRSKLEDVKVLITRKADIDELIAAMEIRP